MNQKIAIETVVPVLEQRLGIIFKKKDEAKITDSISQRARILNLRIPEYLAFLYQKNAASEIEWHSLSDLLTTRETFFFRDPNQLNALVYQIFPNLFKQQNGPVRLWSAGCSSGEEPYSIAMLLVKEFGLQIARRIKIFGTDISPAALTKAVNGIYEAWSFRKVSAEDQAEFFDAIKDTWQINSAIRSMVKFWPKNLLSEHSPSDLADLVDVDVIICRNTFIYFNADTISKILEKFNQVLRPGGYLITGHGELIGQNLKRFKRIDLPETNILQLYLPQAVPYSMTRSESPKELNHTQEKIGSLSIGNFFKTTPISKPSLDLKALKSSEKKNYPLNETIKMDKMTFPIGNIQSLVDNEEYRRGIDVIQAELKKDPENQFLLKSIADCYIHLGEYEQAKPYLEKTISCDKFDAQAYFLLATVYEFEKEFKKTKDLLKKVIYLDPNHTAAHIQLSHILKMEGNISKAEKYLLTANQLLTQQNKITAK